MGLADADPLAGTLTQLMRRVEDGDEAAQAELCKVVYNELRAVAHRARRRSPDCSLATTDVVHDFLGRILADGRLGQMKNRRYLYAAAADQMRRLVIDHWKRKRSAKHGGKMKRVPLDPMLDELASSAAQRCGGDLDALDIGLQSLKKERPRQYEIVQLKFFAGLTNQKIAELLDMSIDTVKRDWLRARARLGAHLIDS